MAEAKRSKEIEILQKLAATPGNHQGSCYVNRMLDHFTVIGPNGSHECLVLELAGPNVSDVIDSHCSGHRLPSHAARSISRQVLQGIGYLASSGIGHGGKRVTFQFVLIGNAEFSHRPSYQKYCSGYSGAAFTPRKKLHRQTW